MLEGLSAVVRIAAAEEKREEPAGIVGGVAEVIIVRPKTPKMPEVTSVVVEVAAVAMKSAKVLTTVEAVAPEDLVTTAVKTSMASTSVSASHRFCRGANRHHRTQGCYRQDCR